MVFSKKQKLLTEVYMKTKKVLPLISLLFVAIMLLSVGMISMKSPRLRSLPQKYSPKSILRDITTYFEDSVFPIREINSML